MAKALGIGGVFFKSRDPAKLAAWYREWLEFPVSEEYTGASFFPSAVPEGGCTVWSPFQESTEYFNPSPREFMINLMVDDVEGVLARVKQGGATVMEKVEDTPYGRFGWFIDPEKNKIEVWQPKPMFTANA